MANRFQRTIRDGAGNVAAAVAVTVTDPVSGNPVTIYSDEALTSVKANPGVTDANGRFDFWAADTVNLVDVTAGEGVSAYTLQDVLIGVPQSQPYPNRAAAEAANIPAPVTRILVLSPSGDTLAYVRDASGTALTTADGGNWSPDGDVYPDHWAENTTPGTTNMAAATQSAVQYLETLGGTYQTSRVLHFLPATYLFGSTIAIRGSNVHIKGAGIGATTILRTDAGAYGPTFRFAASGTDSSGSLRYNNAISDLTIRDTQAGTTNAHIRADGQIEIKLKDLELWNPYIGVHAKSCQFTYENVTVEYDPALYTTTIGFASFWFSRNGLGAVNYTSGAGSGRMLHCQSIVRGAVHSCYATDYNFLINSMDGLWATSCYGRSANMDAFSIWPEDEYSRATGVKLISPWADWPKLVAYSVKNPLGGNCANNDLVMPRLYGGTSTSLATIYAYFVGNPDAALAPGPVRNISISQAKSQNTRLEGIDLRADATDVHITAPEIKNASIGTVGAVASMVVRAGVSNWSVIGGSLDGDGSGGASAAARGITIAPGASNNFQIIGTSVMNCQTTSTVLDNSTGTNKTIIVAGRPIRGVRPAQSTVAGLPSASTYGVGETIYVTNESGGAVLAFSDGTNWRRVTDRAIVS